jgi:hypothetical protein
MAKSTAISKPASKQSKGNGATAKGTKAPAAAASDNVLLNVSVKRSTRTALGKLKLLMNLPNQGQVLDKLVRQELAAAKAR